LGCEGVSVSNIYRIVLSAFTHSMLLTFVLVMTKFIKSEFLFMGQTFLFFFIISLFYHGYIKQRLKNKWTNYSIFKK